ncbi:OmpA/MotB family protein [Aeoliella sp. SH292]|uniref:OmpA/MotB family protein n=1 Tax=Aeoliella sp. SH292 TaxID=3454464 RepID=UPI003F97CEA1
MSLRSATLAWMLLAVVMTTGCGRVVFTPKGAQAPGQPIALTPQQQTQLAMQQQQLQQRADALDRDNQELEALLAQSRQHEQLMRDQTVAMQEQLKATSDRLAALHTDNQQLQSRTQALTASVQQPVGAEIRANNTLLKPLQSANMPGVNVRQDGDTIRVTIAGDTLFAPGSAQLQPGADQLLRQVASDLMTNYPDHRIGIEGHTDNQSGMSAQYPSPHHLSVAQATTVYELLRQSLGASAEQLFVIGHGANHPQVSNATPAGQAQNRRIELVVYPETTRRQ